MHSTTINPVNFRLNTLLSIGSEAVYELAKTAAGTLTSYRLVLGRCLLALDHDRRFRRYGCSSSVHYACSVLGLQARVARCCKRVARILQGLPELTLASEGGTLPWCKLREIVRKATPKTEGYWIRLAAKHSYKELELLVRKTPHGSIPGEMFSESQSKTSELRCQLSEEVFALLDRARRVYSIERDEAVTSAEVLEWALSSYVANQPLDADTLTRVQEESRKDLQASNDEACEVDQQELIAQALGSEPLNETEDTPASFPATDGPEAGRIARNPEKYSATECPNEMTSPTTELLSLARPTRVTEPNRSFKPMTRQNTRLRFNAKARGTTKAQKTEILRRDGWCCNTPGCPNKVWLHLHHLKPHCQGGETKPENLVSLCAGCHRNVHKGLLRIRQEPNGQLVFRNSRGQRLDQQCKLERAGWLDLWIGWKGGQYNSHSARAHGGLATNSTA